MAKSPTLSVEKRKVTGRKVKTLRSKGILPANVYGKAVKSVAVSAPVGDFQKTYKQVGETGLVDIKVKSESKVRPCLITDVHLHPVTDLPLHADFRQVDLTQKVTANVPLEVTGESLAVKEKGAVLISLFDEIEVEALPTDLPDKLTVDISGLKEFNDSILVKDLKIDKSKVKIQMEPKEAIVMVQEPKEEEEQEPAPTQAEEGESGPDGPTDGEAPKEGEEPKEGEGTKPKEGEKTESTKPGQEKPTSDKDAKPKDK